jgi:hypothetical protein
LNRRHLLLSATAGGLALTGLAAPSRGRAAAAPTDDELAFANFGLATELLLADFYAHAIAAKVVHGAHARELARGALNASEHASALGTLLTGAGQTAAVAEDFAFAWPDGTFASPRSISATGVTLTRALLGTYLSAAATISIPSYRTLYAGMAANLGQQLGALSLVGGGRIVGISFPPALGVETASDQIEAYLG